MPDTALLSSRAQRLRQRPALGWADMRTALWRGPPPCAALRCQVTARMKTGAGKSETAAAVLAPPLPA
jgi:hypothetical protein